MIEYPNRLSDPERMYLWTRLTKKNYDDALWFDAKIQKKYFQNKVVISLASRGKRS